VAEAQEQQQQQQQQQQAAAAPATAPATAPAARSAVVAPGDSLWSICQERLGPSAPPRQVALDVRRIHEINRNLIGDDPHLIFPGQRLALPPPAGAPADRPSGPAARPDAGALAPKTAPLQRLKQAAEAHSQAIQEELEETAGGAPDQAARPAAPERAPEPIALPALPEAGAVPEARSLPSSAVPGGVPDVPDDELRRLLLGLGIIALTLVLAGLTAWRLPMRRHAGDAEAWWGRHRRNYHYYPHHGEHRQDRHDPDLLVEPKPRPGPDPTTAPARRHEPAKRHEPGRNGAKGSPRKGLAAAHNPAVRRALRRAPRGAAPTPPGWPPRNRPVGARGPSSRAARRAARGAVVRRHPAKRRLAAGLARGRNR
jgi:LysM domain